VLDALSFRLMVMDHIKKNKQDSRNQSGVDIDQEREIKLDL
jgi:hypothetical protein